VLLVTMRSITKANTLNSPISSSKTQATVSQRGARILAAAVPVVMASSSR
jgi:hypothetical protein